MNDRNPLASPVPWLAAGLGLVVGLVSLLLGAGDSLGSWLQAGFERHGFPELTVWSPSSPFALLSLVILSFVAVLALEGTPGTGRRVMLLLSTLVLLAMASPVFALWGIFWNPFILLIGVCWAGLVALVHASNHDRAEAERAVEEQNVVRMNPPVSPNRRRRRGE